MLSQFVTAARGLFRTEDARGENNSDDLHSEENSNTMVTATRHRVISNDSTASKEPTTKTKRKDTPATSETPNTRPAKRRRAPARNASRSGTSTPLSQNSASDRRYQVLDAVEIISNGQAGTDSVRSSPAPEAPKAKAPMAKNSHLRFEDEDVEMEESGQPEDTPGRKLPLHLKNSENDPQRETEKAQNEEPVDDESSDDDEAPEAVSNVAQLGRLRDEERRQDQAKQRLDEQRREKRREHQIRLQSQASSKLLSKPLLDKKQARSRNTKQDEMLSESSVTLQDTDMKDVRPTGPVQLPKLLPDDILNSEPSILPETPEPKADTSNGRMLKLRRLADTVERRPKDVKLGSTSIRVLDKYNSAHGSLGIDLPTPLPPKSSKSSRRVRESWMAGNKNGGPVGPLRRSKGAPSSFVRG